MEDVRAAIIAGEPAPEEANERLWPAETVVWRSGGGAVWKERTGVFVARIPAGVPVADVVPAVRHVPAKCRKWEKDINTRQDRALIAVREGDRLCYYAPPYSIVRSRG